MTRIVPAAGLLIVALLATSPSSSQQPAGEIGGLERTNVSAPGFFYKFDRGDREITVTTVGAVTANGIFVLGEGDTVGDLLALAGGVSIDRQGEATVRIHRGGRVISEVEIRSLYGDGATPPVLQNGDVVEVVGLTSSVPGFYVHTQPGAEPISVTASGAFAAPGRYRLNAGSTVGDLVAFAGGLGTVGVRDAGTRVKSTVRVYRSGEVIMESGLSELYAQQTMVLQPGDAVDLEVILSRRGSFWRDALAISTAVLSAAVLVERLVGDGI